MSMSALNQYMKDIKGIPLLTPDEEVELAKAVEQGDPKARKRFIEGNYRLVVFVAKGYLGGHDFEFVDLIQEGNIGLIRAVEKFDWRKGYRFSTYAMWHIRSNIERSLLKGQRHLKVPVELMRLLPAVQEADLSLTQRLSRQPSLDELAEETGIAVSDVALLVNIAEQALVSLDPDDLNDLPEGYLPLAETVADPNVDVEHEALLGSLTDALVEALTVLDERELAVIVARFGLDGSEPKTLVELGATLGMSFSGIRKVETRALDKLSKRTIGLESFLYA